MKIKNDLKFHNQNILIATTTKKLLTYIYQNILFFSLRLKHTPFNLNWKN